MGRSHGRAELANEPPPGWFLSARRRRKMEYWTGFAREAVTPMTHPWRCSMVQVVEIRFAAAD
jgi:hypothetical protein